MTGETLLGSRAPGPSGQETRRIFEARAAALDERAAGGNDTARSEAADLRSRMHTPAATAPARKDELLRAKNALER